MVWLGLLVTWAGLVSLGWGLEHGLPENLKGGVVVKEAQVDSEGIWVIGYVNDYNGNNGKDFFAAGVSGSGNLLAPIFVDGTPLDDEFTCFVASPSFLYVAGYTSGDYTKSAGGKSKGQKMVVMELSKQMKRLYTYQGLAEDQEEIHAIAQAGPFLAVTGSHYGGTHSTFIRKFTPHKLEMEWDYTYGLPEGGGRFIQIDSKSASAIVLGSEDVEGGGHRAISVRSVSLDFQHVILDQIVSNGIGDASALGLELDFNSFPIVMFEEKGYNELMKMTGRGEPLWRRTVSGTVHDLAYVSHGNVFVLKEADKGHSQLESYSSNGRDIRKHVSVSSEDIETGDRISVESKTGNFLIYKSNLTLSSSFEFIKRFGLYSGPEEDNGKLDRRITFTMTAATIESKNDKIVRYCGDVLADFLEIPATQVLVDAGDANPKILRVRIEATAAQATAYMDSIERFKMLQSSFFEWLSPIEKPTVNSNVEVEKLRLRDIPGNDPVLNWMIILSKVIFLLVIAASCLLGWVLYRKRARSLERERTVTDWLKRQEARAAQTPMQEETGMGSELSSVHSDDFDD